MFLHLLSFSANCEIIDCGNILSTASKESVSALQDNGRALQLPRASPTTFKIVHNDHLLDEIPEKLVGPIRTCERILVHNRGPFQMHGLTISGIVLYPCHICILLTLVLGLGKNARAQPGSEGELEAIREAQRTAK